MRRRGSRLYKKLPAVLATPRTEQAEEKKCRSLSLRMLTWSKVNLLQIFSASAEILVLPSLGCCCSNCKCRCTVSTATRPSHLLGKVGGVCVFSYVLYSNCIDNYYTRNVRCIISMVTAYLRRVGLRPCALARKRTRKAICTTPCWIGKGGAGRGIPRDFPRGKLPGGCPAR